MRGDMRHLELENVISAVVGNTLTIPQAMAPFPSMLAVFCNLCSIYTENSHPGLAALVKQLIDDGLEECNFQLKIDNQYIDVFLKCADTQNTISMVYNGHNGVIYYANNDIELRQNMINRSGNEELVKYYFQEAGKAPKN